jgi:hypothetical protein
MLLKKLPTRFHRRLHFDEVIAEAGIEAYNYSTPLKLCFNPLIEAYGDISSEAAFDEVFSEGWAEG